MIFRGPTGPASGTTWIRWAWRRLSLPGARRSLGGAALVAYAVVSLWPFVWQPPRHVENGARVSADGTGIAFPSPGLARTAEPPPWLKPAMRANRLEVSLRVRTLAPDQPGPARILTVSRNSFDRNLAVGQQGADLVVGLRTAPGRANGALDLRRPALRVPDVFADTDWVEVDVVIVPGELRVRAGGPGGEVHRRELRRDVLRGWDASHRLALGNDVGGGRPWLGEIDRAVVRAPGGGEDYAADAAELERPASFWIMSREPKVEPFRYLNLRDTVRNLVLYVPLGFLLAFLAHRRRRGRPSSTLVAVGLVAGVSMSLELAQFFVSIRNPSINDLILNTVGGGVGVVIATLAVRRAGGDARRRPAPAAAPPGGGGWRRNGPAGF